MIENENIKIGGPGIIVEIDEMKFGKKKYNRGHQVIGSWIIGGVERIDEKNFFCNICHISRQRLNKNSTIR